MGSRTGLSLAEHQKKFQVSRRVGEWLRKMQERLVIADHRENEQQDECKNGIL
mgnify:CR=1 FL=1